MENKILSIRNLKKKYGKRLVLEDISFDVNRGEFLSLLGPSGCGKTTILRLLIGIESPNSGQIMKFGEDITSLPPSKRNIGIVFQNYSLFPNMNVYENIAYAKKGASKEEVIEAAKKAQAYGFIQRLPQGIDTYISDSSGLSLGEKQLISVTRIILLSPEIVILDEATSNIDIRTEFLLAKSFDELMKGKTSFVVAHRLSTIVNSDLILVMKDGEIVESGTHKELLEKKGFYHKMYSSQFN